MIINKRKTMKIKIMNDQQMIKIFIYFIIYFWIKINYDIIIYVF